MPAGAKTWSTWNVGTALYSPLAEAGNGSLPGSEIDSFSAGETASIMTGQSYAYLRRTGKWYAIW